MTHLFDAPVDEFCQRAKTQTFADELANKFLAIYGYSTSPVEVLSWQNSLKALADVIDTPTLAKAHIFLELKMPISSERCDVILVGIGADKQPHAEVIELKQWQVVAPSARMDSVLSNNRDALHPSAQVRGYCQYLKYYHKAFTEGGVGIGGCCYLHNMADRKSGILLKDPEAYGVLPTEYPIFVESDSAALLAYLHKKVGHGISQTAVAKIARGDYAPSTKLLDVVDLAIQDRFEWKLLGNQLAVFNAVVSMVREAKESGKRFVLIVRGGPGTGKSVLAIQLLAYAARQHWRVAHAVGSKAFVTVLQGKTRAFADAYLKRIYNAKYKTQLPVKELFSTFKNIADIGAKKSNEFDLVVGDEAHRLWDFRRKKYRNYSEQLSDVPMIREVVHASHVTVLFLDDNQSVRADEIGSVAYIEEQMLRLGQEYELIDLNAQFRCAGSESYIQWVDHALGFTDKTSLAWKEFEGYRFEIVSSMPEMQAKLDVYQAQSYKCRFVAGFCWPWSVPRPNGTLVHDVKDARFSDWSAPWIEKTDQNTPNPLDHRYYKWATDESYYSQVGSIYSVQGFEFDYIGLIFGDDLVWRQGSWIGDLNKNRDKGFKQGLRTGNANPTEQIRNIYRVLLTRGIQGTYVFFLDKETRKRFEKLLEP